MWIHLSTSLIRIVERSKAPLKATVSAERKGLKTDLSTLSALSYEVVEDNFNK